MNQLQQYCFTWPDVATHRPLVARRMVSVKDYAWLLLASVPEIHVVDIEVSDAMVIHFTVNAEAFRAAEILEDHRPCGTEFRVKPFPTRQVG